MPLATEPAPVLDIGNVEHALKMLDDEVDGPDHKLALETMQKIVDNVFKKPGDLRPRSIKFMNKAFQSRIGRLRAGLLLMEAFGFQLHIADDTMYLRAEAPMFSRQVLESIARYLGKYQVTDPYENQLAPAIGAGGGGNSTSGMPSRPPTRLVQTGEGFKTATEVKVEKLQAQKELPLTEDPHFERERRLFLPNDPAGEARIDDKEFSLTGTDFQSLGLGKKRKADDKPEMLKTKAMRELERLQAMKVYSKVIMRVRLPNQCILQASFHPRERVSALHAYVQSCLQSPSMKFTLATGHPLRELDREALQGSFAQEGLMPSAIIHFRWAGAAPEGAFLKDDVTSGIQEEIPDVAAPTATVTQTASRAGASAAAGPPAADSKAAQRDADARKAVEDRMKAFMNM